MKLHLLALAIVANVAASAVALRQDSAEPTQVALIVTVADGGSRYLTGLSSTDFDVFEDGVEQRITSVSPASDLPIAFSFLVDTSNSMKADWTRAKAIAAECVQRLRPQDQGQLIAFEARVRIVQAFSSDSALLAAKVGSLTMNGSTALNNALMVALNQLNTHEPVVSGRARSVFVVFSDGDDTSSLLPEQEVLDRLKRTQTLLYAIGIARPRQGREQSALPPFAKATGGVAFSSRPEIDAATICDALLAELTSQYVVTYESSNRSADGKWRRVEVKVSVPRASVRTRQGYYAPRPSR